MGSFLVFIRLVSFLTALLSLAFRYKHLLNVLLSLEALAVSIFILLFSLFNCRVSGEAALIFITLSACEARLGLSILVLIIRIQGNDYVLRISTQKC